MTALTKMEIIDQIAEINGYSKKESKDYVECLLETIKGALEKGDEVLVSGFGKFCVKQKNQRRGRNPATGGEMMITARKVVTFKCSQQLRDKINR